jgi:hypothetical protein
MLSVGLVAEQLPDTVAGFAVAAGAVVVAPSIQAAFYSAKEPMQLATTVQPTNSLKPTKLADSRRHLYFAGSS